MDKKRVKTELLVHDLKNPLSVIETGVHLLLRDSDKNGSLTEMQIKVLMRVMRNAKIAMSLVNDILEVGRSKEGAVFTEPCRCFDIIKASFVELYDLFYPHTVDNIGVCENIIELSDALKKENIFFDMDDILSEKALFFDVRKIEQVTRNLLTNAMKYRKEKIFLKAGLEENYFCLYVMDDGQGISRCYHEKIFENYFQLDNEREQCVRGHGIGLAGSLILVEDMGGKIEIESEEGKGATFIVKIPLSES